MANDIFLKPEPTIEDFGPEPPFPEDGEREDIIPFDEDLEDWKNKESGL